MKKAVIFDMDGVIIDSEGIYKSIENQMYAELGIEVSEKLQHKNIGMGIVAWWQFLKNYFHLDIDPIVYGRREVNTYSTYLFDDTKEKRMMPGVDAFIRKLYEQGIGLAVASGSPMVAIKRVLDLYNLEGYFDTLVSGVEIKKNKPEPDIFLMTAKKLGVEAQDCLVIEDSENGIIAAHAAGMVCVGYQSNPPHTVNYDLADHKIKDFSDLKIDFRNQGFYICK